MKFCASFVRSVVLAVVAAAIANAAPSPADVKLPNVVEHKLSSGHIVKSFHPESSFETFGNDGIDHPLSARDEFDIKEATIAFIQSRLNVDPESIAYRVDSPHDVAHHAYVKQQVNGMPISNAVANIAFNKANKVVAFGSSFVKPTSVPFANPTITAEDAISKAETALSGKHNGQPTKLEYIAKKEGSLSLAHVVHVQDFDNGLSAEAFVDAHSGELVHINNFAAKASYYALPVPRQSPPEGFDTIVDPQLADASPWGWHSLDGVSTQNTTSGNNALAYETSTDNMTTQSSPTLDFIYPRDPSQSPTSAINVDAARVNAFYLVNAIHDIAYLYGFTESAFNFQQNNLGQGGVGNDPVRISVQDVGEDVMPTSSIRKSESCIPSLLVDGVAEKYLLSWLSGQPGDMRLGVFTLTDDARDSAFANDVVVHEFTHGLTSRMTGGGTAQCMQRFESMGLGEGWSDALADWTEQTSPTLRDYAIGSWVVGSPGGIRHYPYSTSLTVNPLRYSYGRRMTDEHDVGEIWANMLHNNLQEMINTRGFDPNARSNPNSDAGNGVWMHLFLDSLLIQPCNPTFINARDAWIQADHNRYGGANNCTLWNVFASRGLGTNARPNYVNGFNVPAECRTN